MNGPTSGRWAHPGRQATTYGPGNRLRQTSARGTRQPQPLDPPQHRREQLTRHRHLRQLEDYVPGMGHYLGPDLDQLLSRRRQRPPLDRLREDQLRKEVAKDISQGEQLQPSLIVLDGLRVIEGAACVAAPHCGMALAQLGADVIRFDPLEGGLDAWRWPVTRDG